jgi:lysophospholipase L1-like esterase
MKPELGEDTPAVHPNVKGYEVMEKLLLPVIKKLR